MKASAVTDGFNRWIDGAANAAVVLTDRWAKPRVVKLTEQIPDEFILEPSDESSKQVVRMVEGRFRDLPIDQAEVLSGSRVELILLPNQFLFRQVELPTRATEFLDGILRAQIDSLTPWAAADCAFGWSEPVAGEGDRIIVTVAATALSLIREHVRVLANAGAHSVRIFAQHEAGDERVIKIWDERASNKLAIYRMRRSLVSVLVGAGIVAALAGTVSALHGAGLAAEQEEIAYRLANARSATATAGPAGASISQIVQRKRQAPSTVLALEDLSRLLPDHTYLTELRVEEHKMRIIGSTRDAPSLIGLLERSGRFAQASFFAPTTRLASMPGERFHIEANLLPVSASGPR